MKGHFSASANYTSSMINEVQQANSLAIYNGNDITLVRGSFAIETSKHWMTSLFVNNATNDRGTPILAPQNNSDPRPRPRTFGLQVDYRLR
jgi:hypothetical protein